MVSKSEAFLLALLLPLPVRKDLLWLEVSGRLSLIKFMCQGRECEKVRVKPYPYSLVQAFRQYLVLDA